MFLRTLGVFLIGVLVSAHSLAQSEEARYRGFLLQQKADKEFDQEREAGLKDYLEDQADWEEQRKKDRQADKQRKVQEAPSVNSPDYRADLEEKYKEYEEHKRSRKAYAKEQKELEPKNTKEQEKRDEWALKEYGLDRERPRFDIAKRNLYGNKPGISTPSSNSGSIHDGNSPLPNFPPPPTFDDFSDGYVPPPFPPPESFEPPPEGFPPPPPIPFPGEPGSDFDGGYFPPPPPPMPMDGSSF